jgi:hypothetical protein
MNEIDYSDKKEWKKFVADYIVPLRDSATILDEYWNYLREHIDNMPLEEIEKSVALQSVLLGGVDEGGNYLEESVAKLYNDFFGVSSSVKVPAGRVCSSPFHEFVTDIIAKTKEVMDRAETKEISVTDVKQSEINYDELLKNPEEVVRLIGYFYNKCAKVTPNYNEYTLFVLNIRAITESYFNVAFPWLLRKFDEVRELLGLRQDFEPPVADMKAGHYVIWRLGEFGYTIKELYEYIWGINEELNDALSQYFDGITDLKQEFIASAKESISSINYEIVKRYDEIPSPNRPYDGLELEIQSNGQIVDSSSPGLLKKDSNVFDFLEEISSLVFVGLVNIRTFSPHGKNRFRIDIEKIT